MARLILSMFCLSIVVFRNCSYIFVSECPFNETLWIEHSNRRACKPGTFYHCLGTTNNRFIEDCLSARALKANRGCPFALIQNHQVYIEQISCPQKLDGCPNTEDGTVNSNSFYTYPPCILYSYSELKNGTHLTRTRNMFRSTTHSNPNPAYIFPFVNVSIFENKEEVHTTKILSGTVVIDKDEIISPHNLVAVMGAVTMNLFCVFCVVLYIQKAKNERYRRSLEGIEMSTSFRDLTDQEENSGEEYVYEEVQDISETPEDCCRIKHSRTNK